MSTEQLFPVPKLLAKWCDRDVIILLSIRLQENIGIFVARVSTVIMYNVKSKTAFWKTDCLGLLGLDLYVLFNM